MTCHRSPDVEPSPRCKPLAFGPNGAQSFERTQLDVRLTWSFPQTRTNATPW